MYSFATASVDEEDDDNGDMYSPEHLNRAIKDWIVSEDALDIANDPLSILLSKSRSNELSEAELIELQLRYSQDSFDCNYNTASKNDLVAFYEEKLANNEAAQHDSLSTTHSNITSSERDSGSKHLSYFRKLEISKQRTSSGKPPLPLSSSFTTSPSPTSITLPQTILDPKSFQRHYSGSVTTDTRTSTIITSSISMKQKEVCCGYCEVPTKGHCAIACVGGVCCIPCFYFDSSDIYIPSHSCSLLLCEGSGSYYNDPRFVSTDEKKSKISSNYLFLVDSICCLCCGHYYCCLWDWIVDGSFQCSCLKCNDKIINIHHDCYNLCSQGFSAFWIQPT
jgi:hypothetical protein